MAQSFGDDEVGPYSRFLEDNMENERTQPHKNLRPVAFGVVAVTCVLTTCFLLAYPPHMAETRMEYIDDVYELVDAGVQTRFTTISKQVTYIMHHHSECKTRPSDDQLGRLYGLYKQATKGDCTASEPWFWDAVGQAKWTWWTKMKGMSTEAAMKAYYTFAKTIIPTLGCKF